MNKNKKCKNPFYIVNRLGIKLMFLTLAIILAADLLTFTSTIIIGMVTGGSNATTQVIGSVTASIIIGALLSFIIGNTVLMPLSELTKATKRVTNGDYSIKLSTSWMERFTINEIRELIRDFNEMTEELRNTELFRNDFITNFSHEFKTPLVSIRGFARQLYEGNLTFEQQKEFSKIILDESEYLSKLSQNTLLMSNLERKDIITDKTVFSLDEQIRNCMILLEPQWSKKKIEIDMENLEEVKIYWNSSLMAHVWNNLFDNAVKFTSEGGLIKVGCIHKNGEVIVTVSDNGCGISEEALSHIFDKFYQADTSHAASGCGLGLPLVKKIIELYGGEISVTSQLGRGTCFTVILNELQH